jgi:hypothetical protein
VAYGSARSDAIPLTLPPPYLEAISSIAAASYESLRKVICGVKTGSIVSYAAWVSMGTLATGSIPLEKY